MPHPHISKAGMDYHHQAIAATFKVADRIPGEEYSLRQRG
jgi:hypothetical protein